MCPESATPRIVAAFLISCALALSSQSTYAAEKKRPAKTLREVPAPTQAPTALPTIVYPDMSACIQKEDHQSITYLLVDRTDKLQNVEHLKQTLHTVHDTLKPGERLIVGVSTAHLSETRILMDLTKPLASIWESTLKIRAREKKFSDCFNKVSEMTINQDESHPSSAILETLGYLASVLRADTNTEKRLIIFSDMIQNSDALSFYKVKEIEVEPTLKKVKDENLNYHFAGVVVSIAGAGTGIDDHKARQIEQFWRKYFEMCGATVRMYGPLLLAP